MITIPQHNQHATRAVVDVLLDMTKHSRFLVACLAGLAAGAFWYAFGAAVGDATWPVHAARRLASGINPYAAPYPDLSTNPIYTWLYYPLPALLLCLPVAWLPDRLAIAVLCGAAFGVLAWAITPRRHLWPMLVSYPVIVCLHYAQPWPLIAAAAWVCPSLAPFALAKPNTALPVLLSRPVWRWLPVGVSAALVLASIPMGWLAHLGSHTNYTVAASLVGAPLALTALRWRQPVWRLVALAVLTPMRAYDAAILSVLPTTPRAALTACVLGWIAFPIAGYDAPVTWLVLAAALPTLVTSRPRSSASYTPGTFHRSDMTQSTPDRA